MPRSPRPAAAASVLVVMAAVVLALPASASSGRVARPGAQVRAETGFGGPVTMSPAEGAPVEILERRNEWVRVRVGEGREGWIHEIFVTDGGPGLPALAPPPVAAPPAAAAPVSAAAPASASAKPVSAPSTSDCDEITMKLLTQNGELFSLRAEVEVQRLQLAESSRSTQMLQDRLQSAIDERDAARGALESAKADALAAGLTQGREEGRQQALAQMQSDAGRQMALQDARAAERIAVTQAAAAARAELEMQHATRLAELEARHQAVMEGWIAMVTQKHDDALAQETAAIAADCERRVIDNNRENERELRAARRDSGYEAELEKEVRARLDTEIEEAKVRWQAKQRGEMYDVERARREEGDRVRRECEGARLAAINTAVAECRAEMNAALAKERQEADLRCEVALALVLERAAQGGDMKKVKELAETTARRRSGDPVNEPPPPMPVEPEPEPEPPSPRPVPVDPRSLPPRSPAPPDGSRP